MRFSRRIRSRVLFVLCAAILGAGLSVPVWTMVWPPPRPTVLDLPLPAPGNEQPVSQTARSELSEFQAVWGHRLQRPATDPSEALAVDQLPPAKPEPAPMPPPPPPVDPPQVQLRSILFSDGRQLAVFQTSDGQEVICGIGERIADAIVKRIELEKVVLEKQETQFAFQLSQPNKN